KKMDDSPVLIIPYTDYPREFIHDIDIKLNGQRRIAEFSVTADREILLNSRANARILIDKRVNKTLKIDLKKGIESIIRQELEEEACLNILLKWACLQKGDNLKEIFDNAEFVGWQGTFRRIAASIISKDAMGIIAIKVDGVIFLSETVNRYGENDSRWEEEAPFYEGFAHFKYKQVMTTNSEGKVDHDNPINNRSKFQVMVRSQLVNDSLDESIHLLVGSTVEALTQQGEPVEFKTIHKKAAIWKPNKTDGAIFRNLNCLLRCDLTDLKWIIFGARSDDYLLSRTMTRGREELEELVNDSHKISYMSLFDILKGIKKFLSEADVSSCVVEFPVETEDGKFIQISAASESETRGILTEEFKRRFSIE
ncbi:hypothetical protein PENTCL1PPCAC_26392, partial [Pristionchus entomophagus]